MKFEVSTKKIENIKADCEIVLVIDKNLEHKWVRNRDDLNVLNFKGKDSEVAFLPHEHIIYVGADSFDHEDIRLACANAIKVLKDKKYKSIKIGTYTQNCPPKNIRAVVEGIILGSYKFEKYLSKKSDKIKRTIIISTEDYSDKDVNEEPTKEAVKLAQIVAKATNYARDIVNTPPDDATPKELAKKAKKLADNLENVKCFIGNKKFLKKEKMGAFLAVSRASSHSPRLIHLVYKPKNPEAKFVFVGKGLTYDSGGLSLKPGNAMVTMKSDKSGSAATLAILKGAAELKLPFEIHAIIGACENMIGGNAYKPDDILVAKNGKTIEVKNTDAEGRLVLADCLCYAQKQEPDFLVDMATLTGACVVALGEYTTGVMGHNEKLKKSIMKAGENSGELSANLPFNRYLKKLLKSEIADISNISSSRYGGAITAALFLDNFIEDEYKDKWVHLDIAGPAFVEKDWGYNQHGGSGAGVRMCLRWLKEHEYINSSKKSYHNKKEEN